MPDAVETIASTLSKIGVGKPSDLNFLTSEELDKELQEVGVLRVQRNKMLACARRAPGSAEKRVNAADILSKGVCLLDDDQCEEAKKQFILALSALNIQGDIGAVLRDELKMKIVWKLFQANVCIGSLPLGTGPHAASCVELLPLLANKRLEEDFALMGNSRGMLKVQHWDAWFELFGFSDHKSCSRRGVNVAFRKLQLQYHPDKQSHSDPTRLQVVRQCAEQASMWVNAGKELLLVHSRCGGYFNGPL